MMTLPMQPSLPAPRGPVSEVVIDALTQPRHSLRWPAIDGLDLLADDDAQLALACCYELHYRSFVGVDDGCEWNPELLTLRAALECQFVHRLEDEIGKPSPISPAATL